MRFMLMRLFRAGLIFFLSAHFAVAAPGIWGKKQRTAAKKTVKIAEAVRVHAGEIRVDGQLKDPIWQRAPRFDDFIQMEPDEGKPGSQKTSFQVAYDAHNLYIGMRAFDSAPDSIYAQLTRRDQISNGDWLGVIIDSYFDHRTAFGFFVNAVGVQMDQLFSNDGNNQDKNWDAVWLSRVGRDSLGWVAEFKIPFSQLRFVSGNDLVWGFQAVRYIYRNNEQDFWSPQPRDAASWVSNFGELHGLKKLRAPRNLELLPYGMTSRNIYPREPGNPFRPGHTEAYNAGMELRYGLTSNITLNATMNPDFGQVEADPSELNLTAYETFFEEKRPFFVEGNDIFSIPLGIGDGEMGSEQLFYSRRIGRAPHYYPSVSGPNTYVKMPDQTHILGAAKITGKTAKGWSIGVLEALTNQEKADVQADNRRYREIVEPYTNYSVFRLKKDFRKGGTTIGLAGTNVLRNIPNANFNFLTRQATAGGLDVNHRWGNNGYQLQLTVYGSHISGSREAIQAVQKSSAHYFQRPDMKFTHFDPNRTSLSGLSALLFIGKIANGHWRGGFGGMTRTPGFEVNDLGYMREANYLSYFTWLGYQEYKPGKFLRDYGLNSNSWASWYYGGDFVGYGVNLNAHFRLLNYWGGFWGVNRQSQQLRTSTLRGGPAMLAPGRVNAWVGFWSDDRKPASLQVNFQTSRDDLHFWSRSFSPGIRGRLRSNLNVSLSVNYAVNQNDMQYVAKIDDDSPHYILAHLDQKLISLTTRINFALTPNLSIQFYGQPYITAGHYSNFREVVRPRAAQYANRFAPYDFDGNPDFNFKQFRSNLVVRWEYHPGSTLFLVWSQGRTDFVNNSAFAVEDDFRSLFKATGNHIFLIKLNHWFSL